MTRIINRPRIIKRGTTVQKRKPKYEEIGLHADMSQFYPLKALFERLLGKPTYLRLKESAHFPFWKTATLKLLDAMHLSIRSTVRIADEQWFHDVHEIIERGKSAIRNSCKIADLFAALAAALIELSFTQMGGMPNRRYPPKTVSLDARYWTFDGLRSVQYVQTIGQKKAAQDERDKLAKNLSRREAQIIGDQTSLKD